MIVKTFCLISIFFNSVNSWCQQKVTEEFHFQGSTTGVQLTLFTDETFQLRTSEPGGIVDFFGGFKYIGDTLVLSKEEMAWFSKPSSLKNTAAINENVPFQFNRFFRKGDDLYLLINNELILSNHLEKTTEN